MLAEVVGIIAIVALFLVLAAIPILVMLSWCIAVIERRRQRYVDRFFATAPWRDAEGLQHAVQQAVSDHLRARLQRDGSLSGTAKQATIDGATLVLRLVLLGKLDRVLPRLPAAAPAAAPVAATTSGGESGSRTG